MFRYGFYYPDKIPDHLKQIKKNDRAATALQILKQMKKKLFRTMGYFVFTLFLFSCTQETGEIPEGTDEVPVTFEMTSINRPTSLFSKKSVSGNTDSELLRYRVAAYKSTDIDSYRNGILSAEQLIPVRETETDAPFATQNSSVALNINLIPGNYIFVVWADYGAGKYDLTHWTDIRFGTANDRTANLENEAFSTVTPEIHISAAANKVSLTLKRMTAQVDIVTLDVQKFTESGRTFEKAVFTFAHTFPSFDAIKQEPGTPSGVPRDYDRQISSLTLPEETTNCTLYSEILFASPEKETTYIDLTTDIRTSGGNVHNKKKITIQANCKTIAEGSLLTLDNE